MADCLIRWDAVPSPRRTGAFRALEQGGGGAAHQLRGLANDHLSVRELDGHGGLAGALGGLVGRGHHGPDVRVTPACCISSSSRYTVWSEPLALAALAQGVVVAADDLCRAAS